MEMAMGSWPGRRSDRRGLDVDSVGQAQAMRGHGDHELGVGQGDAWRLADASGKFQDGRRRYVHLSSMMTSTADVRLPAADGGYGSAGCARRVGHR